MNTVQILMKNTACK